MPAELIAERTGISRSSLWKVESENPAVAMGIYIAVLHALNNMDKVCYLSLKMMQWGEGCRISSLLHEDVLVGGNALISSLNFF